MPRKKKKTQAQTPADVRSSGSTPATNYEYGFREKDYPAFYINNAQFSGSDTDMRIDLCEVQEVRTDKDGKQAIVVTPRVRVFMAWPFVARFLVVMKKNFDQQQEKMAAAIKEMESSQAGGGEGHG